MLELGDYAGLRKRQAEQNVEGATTRIGVGVSTYVEACGGGIRYAKSAVETASVRLTPEGARCDRHDGVRHRACHQLGADRAQRQLGVDVAAVKIVQGDTDRAAARLRLLRVALAQRRRLGAARRRGRGAHRATEVAAGARANPDDLEFEGGTFTGGNPGVDDDPRCGPWRRPGPVDRAGWPRAGSGRTRT